MHKRANPPFWFTTLGALLIAVGAAGVYSPASAADMLVYKSPTCGCCKAWIKHLEQNGFSVEVKDVADVTAMKRQLGLPAAMDSCHTGVIGGYLVEGHVPAEDVRRLLSEKPKVLGIAVPQMPVGSPGMEIPGYKAEPFKTMSFTKEGETQLFADH